MSCALIRKNTLSFENRGQRMCSIGKIVFLYRLPRSTLQTVRLPSHVISPFLRLMVEWANAIFQVNPNMLFFFPSLSTNPYHMHAYFHLCLFVSLEVSPSHFGREKQKKKKLNQPFDQILAMKMQFKFIMLGAT